MKPDIHEKTPKSLLNAGSGFLEGYSHTLNPYTGCSYACSYCYVRRMPVALFRKQEWGSWVDVKQGAAELLKKELAKARKKGPVTIFMSSATDPYQPVEKQAEVTRSLLEVMAENLPDFLFVQTRSPLVARDVELFQRFGNRIRISMTVETDREDIRRLFAPKAPPIPARLNALRRIVEAGVPAQATVAPFLPSTEGFADVLADVVDRVCVDDYRLGDGSGGKRTERLGIPELYEANGLQEWYEPDAYLRVVERLREVLPAEKVLVSQQGFLP
ncbi:radical SAM protein [Tumebacillus sp. ITR2]|uniref:Radical SAM protein n=1 Tax=Tumebacillus amylolyticus TaxID=2801339 RepID=A0ABS1J894_9BACL|nr:radical SAM protein [Tumebacillus amylolyticus]MBL0386474.1 radical SAM protein [Tumebacillus amylolyticus]